MENKLTFSEQVKEETCHLEYNKECAYYILLAFFINNSSFVIDDSFRGYWVTTQYYSIIRLIKKLLELLDLEITFEILKSNTKGPSNKNKFVLAFKDYKKLDELFNHFNLKIKYTRAAKKSFLLGGFLSSGSIYFSNHQSNYHFEIRSASLDYLQLIGKFLDYFKIETHILKFRNIYKIYFKKSGCISDILKLFNATTTLYAFEDCRIQKDFTNSLQRINNLDISNINKTIKASNNQIKWIQTIENKYSLGKLDEKSQLFCKVRKQHPEESLANLSAIIEKQYNTKIARTSLNHIVRRIEHLYLKIKDK